MIDPLQNPIRPGFFMNYAQDETPSEMVLRKLACWLGVGGYNAPSVNAELFHQKIVGGVEILVAQHHALLQSKQAEIALALPAMREYARVNPKFLAPSGLQDPNGVHAWLDRNDGDKT